MITQVEHADDIAADARGQEHVEEQSPAERL